MILVCCQRRSWHGARCAEALSAQLSSMPFSGYGCLSGSPVRQARPFGTGTVTDFWSLSMRGIPCCTSSRYSTDPGAMTGLSTGAVWCGKPEFLERLSRMQSADTGQYNTWLEERWVDGLPPWALVGYMDAVTMDRRAHNNRL